MGGSNTGGLSQVGQVARARLVDVAVEDLPGGAESQVAEQHHGAGVQLPRDGRHLHEPHLRQHRAAPQRLYGCCTGGRALLGQNPSASRSEAAMTEASLTLLLPKTLHIGATESLVTTA